MVAQLVQLLCVQMLRLRGECFLKRLECSQKKTDLKMQVLGPEHVTVDFFESESPEKIGGHGLYSKKGATWRVVAALVCRDWLA